MNWYAYCKNNPLSRVDPYGQDTVTLPTHRMMIMPWRLDPSSSTASLIFAEAAGILIDLKELVDPGLPAPVDKIIDKYLEVLEEQCRGLAGVAGQDTNAWRVFIETQEYADSDHDGKPDLDEDGNMIPLSEPAWVEIRGVRVPGNKEHKGWLDGAGYYSSRDALLGGIVGMAFYPRPIPATYEDPELKGFVYGTAYNASNAVLNALIKIGDILESIKNTLP